jgi:hypothetical protein
VAELVSRAPAGVSVQRAGTPEQWTRFCCVHAGCLPLESEARVSTKPHMELFAGRSRCINQIFTKTHQIAFLRQWRCPNPAEPTPASAAKV